MNWKLIIPLGLTGVVPPLAGHLLALDASTAMMASLALWTLLAAALWVSLALRRAPDAPFLTLLAVGVVAGVAAGAVDFAFTGDAMLLVVAVAVGAVWGALFGGIALGVRRWRGAHDLRAP